MASSTTDVRQHTRGSRPASGERAARSRPASGEREQHCEGARSRPASPAALRRPPSPISGQGRAAVDVRRAVSLLEGRVAVDPADKSPTSDASSKLRVVCRLRPMTDQEHRNGAIPAVTASTEKQEVVAVRAVTDATRQARISFNFDNVLSSFSTQLDVFAVTLKPLVKDVLAGYECAVFAYGQTGTGKTYTMEGDLASSEKRGLVPRAAEALIRAVNQGSYMEHSVTASCLEIYNEELIDLLASTQQKMELQETGRGVICSGLSEVSVSSVEEILEQIGRAQDRRRVAETRINARSSRSHCLFTLKVTCTRPLENGEVEETCGKLHLVDLAGSECARKADDRGLGTVQASQEDNLKGERERRNINQSLLTLGRVIASLRTESQGRIPYRDSKLTRMLQEALGGGCRTVMVATISPAQLCIDETLSTLQYAEQAAGIHNKPAVAACFRSARTPVGGDARSLSFGDLATASSSSGEHTGRAETPETEMRLEYLTQEVQEAHAAFDRKQREVQELQTHVEAVEAKHVASLCQLEEAEYDLAEKSFMLAKMTDFSEARSEDVRRLAAALSGSRARCAELVERSRKQTIAVAGSRKQARDACSTGEHRAECLADKIRSTSASVAAASEEASQLHDEATHAMGQVASSQHAHVFKVASQVQEHVEFLHGHMTNVARDLAGEESIASALGAEFDHDQIFGSMRESLGAGVEVSNVHKTNVSRSALQTAADAAAAKTRSRSVQEAIDKVASAFSSKICARVTPLRQTFEDIETGLEKHSGCLNVSLSQLSEQLIFMQKSISDATKQSDGGLVDTVAGVDAALTKTWREASSTLAAMRDLVSSGLTQLQREHAAETIQQEIDELQTVLVEKAQCELASIAQARVTLTEQVACLRRQLAAEQEALSQLSQQSAAVEADASSMQETFAAVSEGSREAGDALAVAEEEQRRQRADAMERIMLGLKEIVAKEMDGLDQSSVKSMVATQSKLVQITNQSEQGQKMVTAMKDHSCEASAKVTKVVKDWASEISATCGEAETTHEEMRIAVDGLNATRTQAVDRVKEVQTQVSAWSQSCGSVAELVQRAGDTASILETTQSSWMKEWEDGRNALHCQGKRVVASLGDAAKTSELATEKHGQAMRDVANLNADVQDKSEGALKNVDELSKEHDTHRDALADVVHLQAQQLADEGDACAAACQRIEAHAEEAEQVASKMASYAALVQESWQCSTSASSALRESVDTVCNDAETCQADLHPARETALKVKERHQTIITTLQAYDQSCLDLAELPKMWQECVSAEPLSAFQTDDIGEDTIFEDDGLGELERFNALTQRPIETELAAEFRTSPKAAVNLENTGAAGAAKHGIAMKKRAQAARCALKEVQRSSVPCR